MKDATGKIRVVVVDDSALVRSILSTLIDSQADMACIGVASDPLVAREMIRELNPDVITLDVESEPIVPPLPSWSVPLSIDVVPV